MTAALFLVAFQRLFLGRAPESTARFGDVSVAETAAVVPLLALAVVIGLFPRFLLDVIEPASAAVVQLVSR